jgi:hypothetical protein
MLTKKDLGRSKTTLKSQAIYKLCRYKKFFVLVAETNFLITNPKQFFETVCLIQWTKMSNSSEPCPSIYKAQSHLLLSSNIVF